MTEFVCGLFGHRLTVHATLKGWRGKECWCGKRSVIWKPK